MEDKEERVKRLLEKAGAPLPDHSKLSGYVQGVALSDRDGKPQSLPAVGSTVTAIINNIGPCEVLGYFTQQGYLGLVVLPKDPPDWYVDNNGRGCPCHLFGCEYSLALEVK